jgi:DNA-directed RNA polymerase subunit delta
MRRVIVDYAKLTNDILSLLVEKFPEGYEESDIIRFKNAQNELVEAVEVRTQDTIYLVKVSKKLLSRMDSFEEDDDDLSVDVEAISPEKDLDLDTDDDDDDLPKKGHGDDDDDDDETVIEDIEDEEDEAK